MSIPEVKKPRPCSSCREITQQELTPTAKGCYWHCAACGNTEHAFSFAEMAKILHDHLFKLPENPAPLELPSNIKVYLKHHGPSASEMEVSEESLRRHVKLTGKLPVVGKPMFTAPPGFDIPMCAIPYGEVTRIEMP